MKPRGLSTPRHHGNGLICAEPCLAPLDLVDVSMEHKGPTTYRCLGGHRWRLVLVPTGFKWERLP